MSDQHAGNPADATVEAVRGAGTVQGMRVRQTGIALVHEGEYIVPAPGSEAELEPAAVAGAEATNYYFPIELVVVGSLPEEEREALEERIWERLSDALERLL
jgi:hypothetical protein